MTWRACAALPISGVALVYARRIVRGDFATALLAMGSPAYVLIGSSSALTVNAAARLQLIGRGLPASIARATTRGPASPTRETTVNGTPCVCASAGVSTGKASSDD